MKKERNWRLQPVYPQKHLLASLAVAAASLLFNQEIPFLTFRLLGQDVSVAVFCIVSGVFIDVDHIIDFRLNRSHMHETLETRYRKGRMYVIFHGIENIPILATFSVIFPFLIFPTISYLIHIAMDIYSNAVSHEAYSYIVRFRKIMTKAQNMPEHITGKIPP